MTPNIAPPDPRAMARSSDPSTSHEAALAATELAAHHYELVLGALDDQEPRGAERVATLCGLQAYQVRKRLPELRRRGLVALGDKIVKTGSGRSERTWLKAA